MPPAVRRSADEDIAVCQDENGYPYLKGTTFKGLLRESMHDLLEWSGGPTDTVEALLGKEGEVSKIIISQ